MSNEMHDVEIAKSDDLSLRDYHERDIVCKLLDQSGKLKEYSIGTGVDFEINTTELIVDNDSEEFLTDSSTTKEKCQSHEIGTIMNVPEFKTEWVVRKIGPIKTKIPKLMRRTKSIRAFSKICYPSGFSEEIEKEIMDCFIKASIVAAPTAIASGGAAAMPVFWSAFQTCIIAKLPQVDEVIKGEIYTKTTHTGWKGI
ncbi:MAG: hypothetical protein R3F48_01920 [Candidatus Zixiibacteriota bacterium]